MTTIAICDDDIQQARRTASFLENSSIRYMPDIRCFPSTESFLDAIRNQNYAPQITILDIKIGESSGIALGSLLNALLPDCAIIYMTAFLEYATDVYETRHAYFLLKQEMEKRLPMAIERAMSIHRKSEVLLYRTDDGMQSVSCEDVVYLEQVLRKTRIKLRGGELWSTQVPSVILKTVSDDLFIRCHQSYWVNYTFIKAIRGNHFLLLDGSILSITRTWRRNALDRFYRHLNGIDPS